MVFINQDEKSYLAADETSEIITKSSDSFSKMLARTRLSDWHFNKMQLAYCKIKIREDRYKSSSKNASHPWTTM